MSYTRSLALAVALAWIAAAAPVAAHEAMTAGTGALHAIKKDGTPLGACPLQHTSISARISGFVARVLVTQTFTNPFPDPIEAIYTFPLSDRGAVDAMWMRTADRVIRGEIKEREEARKIYEQARAEGKLAGLLDQERPNIFTQSIANLVPGATVTVEIEYVEPLTYDAGAFSFTVPTVVGPRFIPGTGTGHQGTGWSPDTTRVPDGSRISPPVTAEGTRAGHDLDIQVQLDAGVPILELSSPLHEIDVERDGTTRASVRLRNQKEIPNRDFLLRYTVAAEEVRSGYITHRPEGKDGYLSLMLVPPRRVTAETAAPKEMIFVIDRSGSQGGLPLQKAQETMHWILDHMNPNDTFQIVDFGSNANVLFAKPELASATMKRRARAHIDGLEANGGTMMAEAVRKVCSMPADAHRLRVVVFMTDGYIGNDFEVLSLVRELRGTSRWFPFGTGNSVNRFLLDGMAKEGGGEVEYVLLSDSGEQIARRFWERIGSPVLTDVKVEVQDLDLYDLYPNQVADVWAERPLIIHGRYRSAGKGRVILHGYQQGAPYEQTLEIDLPERAADNSAVASMWARATIDNLMARDLAALQSGQFPDALKQKIIAVALEHRIMSQFTSFVAVEDKVVNEGGQQRTVTVPVEMPDGVRYEGIFGAADEADMAIAGGAMHRGLPASPMAKRAYAGRLGAAGAALNQPMQEAVLEPESRPASPPVVLKDDARERLVPELQTLFNGGRVDALVEVIGDQVRIKVLLSDTSPETLKALAAAGLQIDQQLDGAVVGRIAVSQLPTLAELDQVTQVALP